MFFLKLPTYACIFAMRHRGWLLSVAVLFLVAPALARAEPVDHIVATVNNEVITASELALAVALNARFSNAGTDGKRSRRRPSTA